MKYIYLFIGFFTIALSNGLAQTDGDSNQSLADRASRVVPPSPTASSLGRFIDVPVSYYSGQTQISIPIAEVQERELKIPISLNYHSGGLKVDDLPGLVGVSWALETGGIITRTMRGKPDDQGNGFLRCFQEVQSIAFKQVDLNNGGYGKLTTYADGSLDSQPDVFFYSIPGYSGKMYLKPGGGVVLTPHRDIKVTPILHSPSNSVQGFTITTPDGTLYTFNVTEITSSVDFPNGGDSQGYISSWYLSSIRSKNGYTISYEYYPDQLVKYNTKLNHSRKDPLPYQSCSMNGPEISVFFSVVQIQNAKKLKKISSSNGYVEFFISPYEYTVNDMGYTNTYKESKLDKIEVRDASSNLIKKYNLTYTGPNDRLKLESLSEVNSSDCALPAHIFNYYGGEPGLYSHSQDYWGYNNGKSSTYLYPKLNYGGLIYEGADRSPDPTGVLSQAGSLESISYPTGGKTTFIYEAHRVKNDDGSDRPIGGIRIKRVIHTDPVANNSFQKDYQYDEAFLMNEPSLDYYPTTRGSETCNYMVRTSKNQSLRGDGQHIIYPHVTEFNNSINQNGKTEYIFSEGINIGTYTYPFPPPTDNSWQGGLLLEKKISSGTGKLLLREVNTYQIDINNSYSYNGFAIGKMWEYAGNYNITGDYNYDYAGLFNVQGFSIDSRWQYLSKKETYQYDENDSNKFVKTTDNFYYENPINIQLTRKNSIDSRNKNVEISYKYPHDFSNQFPYNEMLAAYIINPIIEQQEKVGGANTHFKRTEYGKINNLYLPTQVITKLGSGNPYVESTIEDYDGRGNPLQVRERNGIITRYNWYTSAGKKDLLESKNTGYGSTISHASSYDYKALVGLTRETDPNGRSIFYNYDSFNRLLEVREGSSSGNLLKSYAYKYGSSSNGCTTSGVLINVNPTISPITDPTLTGGTGTCNYTNNQLLGHANGVNAGQALYVKVVGNCKYVTHTPGGEAYPLDWLYMLRNNNGWASGVTPLTSDEIPVCFKQPGESCPGGCSTPAAPNVSASATSINSGQSSTLTASNCSGTVTWSSGQSGSSIQVSPTATTTYTATCTVGSCSSPASSGVTVTVGNRLQVAISGITGQASTKKRVTISNPYSGNRTYLWYIYRDSDMQYIGYGTDISSSTGVFDVDLASYNLVSGTVYRLYVGDTGDSGNSRHGYNTFTIGSSASNCNFTVSTPSTVSASCGGTVSLSASCSGNDCSGVSYSWSGPNNFTGSGSSVSLTAPGTAGSYTYTVTASKSGCTTQQKQVTLTVSCGATGTCNYTNNQLLGHANGVNAGQALYVKVVGNCKYVTHTPGGEAYPLDWLYMLRNNNGWASGVTPLTSDEIPVCFKQPSEGCSSTSSCAFTVSTPSTASASCGATVSLSASCSGNDCSGVSYSWSGPNNFTGSGSSVSLTAPGTAGSYTYTVTASKSGCTSQQKQVTLTVSCGATGTCNYTNNQLLGHANGVNAGQALYVKVVGNCKYVTHTPGGEAYPLDWLYMLRNNNGWASGVTPLTSDEIPVCFKQPGESCPGGCSTPAAPNVSASATSINSGQSSTLTASNCSGTVSWSSGQSGSSIQVSPTATTTYTATCTVGSCSSPASSGVTVTVGNRLQVAISGITGQASTKKRVTISNPYSGNRTYLWYIYRDSDMQYIGYGTDISSSTGVFDVDLASYNLVSGTVYRLYVGDTGDSGNSRHGYNTFTIGSSASNCNFNIGATVSGNTIVNCNTLVQFQATCVGNDCSGVSYAWTGNGANDTGATVNILSPVSNGTYTYTLTASKSGCTSKTETINITTQCNGSN